MKKIHCSGCGMSENLDAQEHKIKTIIVSVIDNDTPWVTPREFESDLCPDCRGRMLHTYFDIGAKGKLETPAFIEPRSLRVAK